MMIEVEINWMTTNELAFSEWKWFGKEKNKESHRFKRYDKAAKRGTLRITGICGSATNNKMGSGIFTGVENLLNQTSGFVFGDTTEQAVYSLVKDRAILYPNPAYDVLNVKYHFPDGLDRKLVVFDMVGREVLMLLLTEQANHVTASITHLPSGVYSYSVISKDRKTDTGKLTISR